MCFLDLIFPTISQPSTTLTEQAAPITSGTPLDPMMYWGPILIGIVIIAVTFSIIYIKRTAKKPLEPVLTVSSKS